MRKNLWQGSAYLNKLFFVFSFLLCSAGAFSQTIVGTVTDADKKPLSNVTVQVKGTTRSTVTDGTGKFSINASGNEVLLLSNVGYTTQEVSINGRQSLIATLELDVRNMENVIVTAL